MKSRAVIFFTLLIGVACTRKTNEHQIEYVKAFTIYQTDSVNDYNKGLGVYWLLSHDFNTDSSITRFPVSIDPTVFKTYVGEFNNAYLDTLINTIEFLKKFPNGPIPVKDSTSTYCGPEFYLEFKDADGVHFYNFIVEDDPPVNAFSHFFYRVNRLDWTKKEVNNSIVDSDKEAVNAAVKAGFYNEIYPHYVSALCGEGINLSMLQGSWRIAGHRRVDTYKKNEFTKDGYYYYERIEQDSSVYKFAAKYTLDTNQKLITLYKDGSTKKLKILKLTEDCLEFEYVKEKYKIELHRIE